VIKVKVLQIYLSLSEKANNMSRSCATYGIEEFERAFT